MEKYSEFMRRRDARCRIKPDAGFWIRDAGYRRKADPEFEILNPKKKGRIVIE
jgi:hypothetical protein